MFHSKNYEVGDKGTFDRIFEAIEFKLNQNNFLTISQYVHFLIQNYSFKCTLS